MRRLVRQLGSRALVVAAAACCAATIQFVIAHGRSLDDTIARSASAGSVVIERAGPFDPELVDRLSALVPTGTAISLEHRAPFRFRLADGSGLGGAIVRGVDARAFDAHPQVRLTAGRLPAPGRFELVVGARTTAEFASFAIGQTIRIGRQLWRIVGIIEAPGTIFESEIWCDRSLLQRTYPMVGGEGLFVALDVPADPPLSPASLGGSPEDTNVVPARLYLGLLANKATHRRLRVLAVVLLFVSILGAAVYFLDSTLAPPRRGLALARHAAIIALAIWGAGTVGALLAHGTPVHYADAQSFVFYEVRVSAYAVAASLALVAIAVTVAAGIVLFAFARGGRVSRAVIHAATAGAMVLFATILISYARYSALATKAFSIPFFAVASQNMGPFPFPEVKQLQSALGDPDHVSWFDSRMSRRGFLVSAISPEWMLAVRDKERFLGFDQQAFERWRSDPTGVLVVTEALADKLGVVVGDPIDVPSPFGKLHGRVSGVFDGGIYGPRLVVHHAEVVAAMADRATASFVRLPCPPDRLWEVAQTIHAVIRSSDFPLTMMPNVEYGKLFQRENGFALPRLAVLALIQALVLAVVCSVLLSLSGNGRGSGAHRWTELRRCLAVGLAGGAVGGAAAWLLWHDRGMVMGGYVFVNVRATLAAVALAVGVVASVQIAVGVGMLSRVVERNRRSR